MDHHTYAADLTSRSLQADPTSGSLQGSEGHARHARRNGMDCPKLYGGPDKRVSPSGPDKQVPPGGRDKVVRTRARVASCSLFYILPNLQNFPTHPIISPIVLHAPNFPKSCGLLNVTHLRDLPKKLAAFFRRIPSEALLAVCFGRPSGGTRTINGDFGSQNDRLDKAPRE